MRVIQGEELLGGSDHEFLVTLYTTVLNRWPDEDGYRHYLGRIEGRAEARRAVLAEVATSEEARRVGVTIRFGDEPLPATPPEAPPASAEPPAAVPAAESSSTPPAEAAAPALAGEIAALRRDVELLRVAAATADAARSETGAGARLERIEAALEALRAQVEGLRADLDALRRHTDGALKRQFADYVNDLLSIERAHLENRLRLVEKHMLEGETPGAR